QRDRALLAIGDRGDAVSRYPLSDDEFTSGGGAACRESEVVFTGAALIGMAFDLDRDMGILLEPGCLTAQRLLRLRRQRRLVGQEIDPVADIDGEVLRRAGRGHSRPAGLEVGLVLFRAGRKREKAAANDGDPKTGDTTHHRASTSLSGGRPKRAARPCRPGRQLVLAPPVITVTAQP